MSSETTPAHAPSGSPCDVADLVEIIAEQAIVGDNTGRTKRQLNETLERLIAERVRAALANLPRPQPTTGAPA